MREGAHSAAQLFLQQLVDREAQDLWQPAPELGQLTQAQVQTLINGFQRGFTTKGDIQSKAALLGPDFPAHLTADLSCVAKGVGAVAAGR